MTGTQRYGVLRGAAAFATAVAAAALSPTALSAEWPRQPVRVIVPFSTGGGTDIQARLLAESFHRNTKQTFIVDNRPGASGLIGAQLTVEAPADGSTILFTTATLAINPTLYGKRWTVQPLKDLAPVSWITSAPLVLITHPAVPAKSVKELIALGRKQPGLLNCGVNTPGSTSHLAAEMFRETAELDTTLVPFKGGGQVRAFMKREALDPVGSSAEELRAHLKREIAKYAGVIDRAGVQLR